MAVSTLAAAVILLFGTFGTTALRADRNLPNPQDLVRDGCDIRQVNDEGTDRWHLVIWADILNVKPDPDCPITPKHAFCDSYSMQPSLDKAQKDCKHFLDGMRKAVKKAGRK